MYPCAGVGDTMMEINDMKNISWYFEMHPPSEATSKLSAFNPTR